MVIKRKKYLIMVDVESYLLLNMKDCKHCLMDIQKELQILKGIVDAEMVGQLM